MNTLTTNFTRGDIGDGHRLASELTWIPMADESITQPERRLLRAVVAVGVRRRRQRSSIEQAAG